MKKSLATLALIAATIAAMMGNFSISVLGNGIVWQSLIFTSCYIGAWLYFLYIYKNSRSAMMFSTLWWVLLMYSGVMMYWEIVWESAASNPSLMGLGFMLSAITFIPFGGIRFLFNFSDYYYVGLLFIGAAGAGYSLTRFVKLKRR